MSAPPPGVVVRAATPADHPAIGQLTLDAYDAVGRVSDAYRVALRDVAGRTDDETAVLVATVDGQVVGSVTLPSARSSHFEHRGHGDGGIRMLAVAPAAQGHGVGRALLDATLAHARDDGWRRLVFTSMEWMRVAHGLYLGAGALRRPDLDVRYESGIGLGFQLDVTPDAADHFPPPGPARADPPVFRHAPAGPPSC